MRQVGPSSPTRGERQSLRLPSYSTWHDRQPESADEMVVRFQREWAVRDAQKAREAAAAAAAEAAFNAKVAAEASKLRNR